MAVTLKAGKNFLGELAAALGLKHVRRIRIDAAYDSVATIEADMIATRDQADGVVCVVTNIVAVMTCSWTRRSPASRTPPTARTSRPSPCSATRTRPTPHAGY